jgi:hypothetical protein
MFLGVNGWSSVLSGLRRSIRRDDVGLTAVAAGHIDFHDLEAIGDKDCAGPRVVQNKLLTNEALILRRIFVAFRRQGKVEDMVVCSH